MSGLDEQNKDYPQCPECGKCSYWFVKSTIDINDTRVLGFCFLMDSYIKAHSYYKTKLYDEANKSVKDFVNIGKIVCCNCGYLASTDLKEKIIDLGRKYFGVRVNERIG